MHYSANDMKRFVILLLGVFAAVEIAAAQQPAEAGQAGENGQAAVVREAGVAEAAGAAGAAREAAWLDRIAPGFDTVARNPVEYRRVLDKFSAAIVRLPIRDCAIAYYGFPMQNGFTTDVAGEQDMQRAIMADDYATAYALGLQILERAPVNLTALYWTLFAATETSQSWEVRNSLRGRYNSIVHIISLSGDGTASETALKVVWPGDMYTYTMLELGLEIGDGYLWDSRWTEFEVTPGIKFSRSSIFFEPWPTGTATATATAASK
jgi:hypothetical protein